MLWWENYTPLKDSKIQEAWNTQVQFCLTIWSKSPEEISFQAINANYNLVYFWIYAEKIEQSIILE